MGLSLNLPENVDEMDSSEIEIDEATFPVQRYKPLRKIESGASGTVYLCFDKELRRKVAVKILQSLKQDQIVGFQNEARLTARLHHPNIVSILDFGTTGGGTPYMVLEFANGFNLEKVIKERGPLRVDLAIELFLQVCDALGYAHESGVFHRDIKSSNIIVSEREKIFAHVIDFGVASFANPEPTIFQGLSIVGTPTYMSPDQARGLTFDERSELYSFGCVMYEVLTGRLPFDGPNALVILGKHASEEVPSMNGSKDIGEIPSEVEELVAKCLRKNRNERFAGMKELKQALLDLQTIVEEKENAEQTAELSLFEEDNDELSTDDGKQDSNKVTLLAVSVVGFVIFAISAGWYLLFARTPPTAKVATVDPNRLHEKLFLPDEETMANSKDLFVFDKEGPGVKVAGNMIVKDSDLAFLKNRTDIVSVNLARTKVKGPGLAYIVNNPIGYLDLGSSLATDEACEQIAMMKSIKLVVLRGTEVTNAGINKLKNLPLESMHLGNNYSINDETLLLLTQFKNLRTADIAFTSVKGTTFPDLNKTLMERIEVSTDDQPLSFFQNLAKLKIRGLGIHGRKPIPLECIAELNNRRFLAIVAKPLSTEELAAFGALHVMTLDLGSTGLTDEKLDALKNSPLRRLGLHREVISDAGLLKLAKLPNLRALLLDYCGGITAGGINALQRARPGLKIFDKQTEF
jgi:Serine/threonine protein kinase